MAADVTPTNPRRRPWFERIDVYGDCSFERQLTLMGLLLPLPMMTLMTYVRVSNFCRTVRSHRRQSEVRGKDK